MQNEEKSKYRQIKEGLYTVTNKELKNGEVIIPKGTGGKIVHAQNQVTADIWLHDDWKYKKHLNLETNLYNATQFRGLVLTLKAMDFAIKYSYNEHSDMMFYEKQLIDVPYLNLAQLTSYEGSFYENNQRVREYKLIDIITSIDDGFRDFVNKLEQRPSTEDDSGDLDYVFTDSSIELFEIEKDKILEPFMKATGIYYNFMGGAIEG